MSWSDFHRRYQLRFEGGYRYLDCCGAFMLDAEETLDLLPSEEPKPTGARMEKPEQGVVVTLDASQLNIVEELSGQGDDVFLPMAVKVGELAVRHIEPRLVFNRMFRASSFLPTKTLEQALRYTVEVDRTHQSNWAEMIGMSASHKRIDYAFSSGSLDVNVVLSATTFEAVTLKRSAAGLRASEKQKRRAERFNIRAEKLQVPANHVVMLDVGITEFDPPAGGERALFEQLRRIDNLVKESLPKEP